MRSKGFTLLEVLTATVMFSITVGALYSVFHSALRMRENLQSRLDRELSKRHVMTLLKRDIAGVVAENGLLCGPMLGEKEEEGDLRLDELEIFSTSGALGAGDPWGEVQKVRYFLREPEDSEDTEPSESMELIRETTRNLLSSIEEEPEEQMLLESVKVFKVTYFDGEYWQDSWDSTTLEEPNPEAIKIEIEFPDGEHTSERPLPIDLIIPVVARAAQTGGSNER